MVSGALRIVSTACCLLVVVSFILFAHDQIAGASEREQTALQLHASATPARAAASTRHAQPRQFIDSTAHLLTSPFTALVRSDNEWVTHGLPAIMGLLVYGIGLGYAARFSRGLP